MHINRESNERDFFFLRRSYLGCDGTFFGGCERIGFFFPTKKPLLFTSEIIGRKKETNSFTSFKVKEIKGFDYFNRIALRLGSNKSTQKPM